MQLREILPFIIALSISAGGVFILVLAERMLVTQPAGARDQRRFFFWGTAASLLMLAGLLTAIWVHYAPDSGWAQLTALFALFALAPILVGALVFLVINWQPIGALGARSLPILVPLAGLLILLALFNPGLILVLLAVIVLLALLWQIQGRAVDWLSMVVLLGLAIQKIAQPDIPLAEMMTASGSASQFGQVANIALSILMLLPYVLPALLVYNSLKAAERQNRVKWMLRLGLAALLLLFIAYDVGETAFWASAQSRFASDNFPFQAVLPLVFGLLLALFLPGWRRLAGALYGLLVPALLIAGFVAGWNISNRAVTSGRAQRLENSLSSYYRQNGRYPDMLEQLTPGYLLFNLPPAGNDLDRSWCYQSGPDAFQLGYIAVNFVVPYRMPDVSVKILKQVGSLPGTGWDCDSKAQAVKAIYAARYH
jgi:hypothetical protein